MSSLKNLPGYFVSMAIGAASGAAVGAALSHDALGGMAVGIVASGASSTFHRRTTSCACDEKRDC